jgi:glycosyltransferase involved in cell wall biosynthesis
MRVLHVIPFLWSGAGKVVTRLCETQRASHQVHVATSVSSKGQTDWRAYRLRLKRAGIVHHRLDTFDRSPEVMWASIEALTTLIARVEPDVLHAHAGVPAAVCAIARDSARVRPRLVAHMYSWGTGRPSWMNQMDAWAFSRADAVVVSAHAYADVLTELGVPERRLHYIPWGIDFPEAMRVTSGARRGAAPATLGFVGRIEPRKRQLDLVKAVGQLAKHRPGVRLDLVGPVADPAYAARIEHEVRRARLESAVRMHGRVREVWPRLRALDLFVSLSADEGQGLAVLEAMSIGVPVASLIVPGIEDYLRPGVTGIALEDGPSHHLAAQLDAALAAPATLRRLAARAAAKTRKDYAWSRTIDRIARLYR